MNFSKDELLYVVQHFSVGTWGVRAVTAADWDAGEISEAIWDKCQQYGVDMLLAVAQGVVESHFGVAPTAVRSRKTKNIYNVGNVDSGADEGQVSWAAGIGRYCRLMKREYNWQPDEIVSLQMMVEHDFRRPRGGRYASAPNYTVQVASVAQKIRTLLRIEN